MPRHDAKREALAARVAAKKWPGGTATQHGCRICFGSGRGPTRDPSATDNRIEPDGKCHNCDGYGFIWGSSSYGAGPMYSVDDLVEEASAFGVT